MDDTNAQRGNVPKKGTRTPEELRKKHLSVAIGVAGSMAFVVAVWALALPDQLGRAREGAGTGLAAWSMMRAGDQVQDVQDGWQATTKKINDLIDSMKFDLEPKKPEPQLSEEAIGSLKAQIEAAAAAAPEPTKK